MSFRKILNEVGGFIPEFDKRGDESALFLKQKANYQKLFLIK